MPEVGNFSEQLFLFQEFFITFDEDDSVTRSNTSHMV